MRGSALRSHILKLTNALLDANDWENLQVYGQWTIEDSQNWLFANRLRIRRVYQHGFPGLLTNYHLNELGCDYSRVRSSVNKHTKFTTSSAHVFDIFLFYFLQNRSLVECCRVIEAKIYSRTDVFLDRRPQKSKCGTNCAWLLEQRDILALG